MLGSWASSSSSLLRPLESEAPLVPVLVVRRVRRPSSGWIQISRLNSRRSILAASETTPDDKVEVAADSLRRLLLASLASRRLRSCCSYWEIKKKKKKYSKVWWTRVTKGDCKIPFYDSRRIGRRGSPWPIGKDWRPLNCACKGKQHPACVSVTNR